MTTARGVGLLGLAVLACVVAGWRVLHGQGASRPPTPPPGVPVVTATAERRDVPVFLAGLGTVQAFNTVEIRAQVNGTLTALPVHEGQEVHAGDIVAEIDPRPYQAALDQAIAQRQEDAAMLRSAQLDLRRFQDLAKRQFAPVQQVDDQQATVSKDQAAVAADDAAIEAARINLDYCVIHAPIDGRAGFYQLDAGNLVQTASPTNIVSITQDKPISVVFTLPEGDLAQVRAALARGVVPVEAASSEHPDDVARGTLLTPNNTVDTNTGTIALKATFDNADNRLWPGEFVNTRVEVDTLRHAVRVPEPAVEHGPDGLFVYAVKPDQTVAAVAVEVGYQDGGNAVVTKGLAGGETVVVSGQSRLAPGMRVAASAGTPAGQVPTDDRAQPDDQAPQG
jgi:multidrug efflux system membrane fusion protein